MTDRDALRWKIAVLLRVQHCDRHGMDPDRYGLASLDVHDQGRYIRDAHALLALIEPLVGERDALRRSLLDAARFIPGDKTIEINGETNRMILAAMDAQRAALAQERP